MIKPQLHQKLQRLLINSPVWNTVGILFRPSGLIVLMYHRIATSNYPFEGQGIDNFSRQMKWIKAMCTPIHPEEINQAIQRKYSSKPPVLVTFDDGYKDYFDCAWPILKSLEIPSLVFLSTHVIDQEGIIWTDLVQLAFDRTRQRCIDLPWIQEAPVALETSAQRQIVSERIRSHLKNIKNSDRLQKLNNLLEVLGLTQSDTKIERQMLSWNEIRACKGLTVFGGHGHSHAILSRLSPTELQDDIRQCQTRITEELGSPSRYFAYPNGQQADFSTEAKKILDQFGFTVVFSSQEGINSAQPNRSEFLRLPGYGTEYDLGRMIYRQT